MVFIFRCSYNYTIYPSSLGARDLINLSYHMSLGPYVWLSDLKDPNTKGLEFVGAFGGKCQNKDVVFICDCLELISLMRIMAIKEKKDWGIIYLVQWQIGQQHLSFPSTTTIGHRVMSSSIPPIPSPQASKPKCSPPTVEDLCLWTFHSCWLIDKS